MKGLANAGAVSSLVLTAALWASQATQDRGAVRASSTPSGRRVALVIGNRDYAKQPLANPVNDANDLSESLRGLGFQTTLATNLTKIAFERVVREFAASVQPGDAALFFFSGHGVEVDGQNYLLPVDFDAEAEEEVKYQAMPASLVLDRLHARSARTSVLIFDACRNNPYRGWRSVSGGLANMSGSGVYVAFAAAPGKTADDNPRERNGRFTKELLAVLRQPGLSIDEVFNRVREQVAQESGGAQVPFSNSGLIGGFVFNGAVKSAGPVLRNPASLTAGIGPFQFGLHSEQVNYPWKPLALAAEYEPVEMRYIYLAVARLPQPTAKGSIWAPFEAFQSCWSGNGHVAIFFTEKGGLQRISFRMDRDCLNRVELMSNWAAQYQIPATGTPGHLMFRGLVNGVAIEGHRLRTEAYVDIFPEKTPQPAESWWK